MRRFWRTGLTKSECSSRWLLGRATGPILGNIDETRETIRKLGPLGWGVSSRRERPVVQAAGVYSDCLAPKSWSASRWTIDSSPWLLDPNRHSQRKTTDGGRWPQPGSRSAESCERGPDRRPRIWPRGRRAGATVVHTRPRFKGFTVTCCLFCARLKACTDDRTSYFFISSSTGAVL